MALSFAVGISGCGGGSSNNNNSNGGGNNGGSTSRSTVTGTVTDAAGDTMVGIQVAIGSQTATTTQFGTYSIPDVVIPSGQTSLVTTVTALATLNGRSYSGSNTVEVLASEPLTNNIHIVVSPIFQQGGIRGTVRDNQGRALQGARVFAAIPNASSNTEFNTLSSITAYTDANGDYVLPNLPAATYTVTASFAGRVNQTLQNLNVTAGSNINASFTLVSGSGGGTPVVANFSAYTLTTPATPTRAAESTNFTAGMEAVKQWVRSRHLKRIYPAADPKKVFVGKTISRATPAGTIIESDLFWDYTQLDNLFGYVVLRSDNIDTNFRTIALLRDPLAARFADVDTALTPDLLYYYSLARLDTVNFPAKGDEGTASDPVSVQPLNVLSLTAPTPGATPAAPPTFSWNTVNRVSRYQILLYDRFPNYQSKTAADGVAPIWSPEATSPRRYDGPALVSGKTYYWAVLGIDSAVSAYTISPIQSFIAP